MRIGRQAPLRLNQHASSKPSSTPRIVRGSLLAAAMALGGLAACAPVEITPPQWQLDQLTIDLPPKDPLQRDPAAPVVVKNGKGEVLAQSVPDRYGDFSANPPLSAFDGTFVIETKRNDGTIETQRVTYPAGQAVKLKRDPETGRYVAEVPPKRYAHPQVTGELGAMSLDRPDAKLFRREDGGIIRGPAIKQSNNDDGSYGSVGVDLPLDLFGLAAKGTRTFISLRGGYGESTSSSSIGDIPANGDQFGIFTPGNGIVTGQDLRDTAYSSEYQEKFGSVNLRKLYPFHGTYLNSSIGASYGQQSVDEHLSTRTSISNTVIDHRQNTDSHYYGMPLSTSIWLNPFSCCGDFWLTAGGNIEPRYHRGETDWRVAATGLADRTQTLKDNAWSVGGGVHLGAYFGDPLGVGSTRFPISAGFKLGVQWSAFPQVEYKDLNRGDGGAALEHKTGDSVYGAVQVRMTF